MQEWITQVNDVVNGFVWGPIMLVLLVGTGIQFTIRTGFFQFRFFGHVMKNTVGKLFSKEQRNQTEDGLTPFQAMSTALAGTIGTGNIVGVAGAIAVGGPGAVFWMWVSALFGMMTKFSEVALAVRYRERNEKGEWSGGPMYYIANGLGKNWKWLAAIFALLATVASFGIGNMTQVNAISSQINRAFGIPPLVTGIVVAVLVGMVILGGVKRIGQVTEKLVPFMSIMYIVFAVVTLVINAGEIPHAFQQIFSEAFSFQSVAGGTGGYVIMSSMKNGFARGVFSNEAGLGSAPIAHAAADTKHPIHQALYGVFEVFVDTIIVCTLTALVVITGGVVGTGLEDSALAAAAFGAALTPAVANVVMAVAILCFAFSTIVGWAYYGSKCLEYLGGTGSTVIYKVLFILCLVVGATMKLDLAWSIADTLNGMMAIPNLIALLALSGQVVSMTRKYVQEEIHEERVEK